MDELTFSNRDILDSDEFGSQRFFIEALLSTSDYDYFYHIMVGEMRRLANTKK